MALIKKILLFIFLVFIITFNLFCLEYFFYSIFRTKLQYPVFALIMLTIMLIDITLCKYNFFDKYTQIVSIIIIFLSIGISLWMLKYVLFIWGLK
jgi:hypothetical protein